MRYCDSNGEWGTPVVSNCSSYEYRSLMAVMEQVCLYIATSDYGERPSMVLITRNHVTCGQNLGSGGIFFFHSFSCFT